MMNSVSVFFLNSTANKHKYFCPTFLLKIINQNIGVGVEKLKKLTHGKKYLMKKLVKYLLKITRLLMKSGTNLYSIKLYNIL